MTDYEVPNVLETWLPVRVIPWTHGSQVHQYEAPKFSFQVFITRNISVKGTYCVTTFISTATSKSNFTFFEGIDFFELMMKCDVVNMQSSPDGKFSTD